MLHSEAEEPLDPEEQEAKDSFDEQIRLASTGNWSDLGLDDPEITPATIDEFLQAT